MKKIIILFCLTVLVCGCGKKSELVHDDGFPRDYPVY